MPLSIHSSMERPADILRITAWNMRGLATSKPYLRHLLDDSDIGCVSEHGLYEPELYKLGEVHEEVYAFGKSSESLNIHNMGKVPGHSGIGIMWRKSYSGCIKKAKGSYLRSCMWDTVVNRR